MPPEPELELELEPLSPPQPTSSAPLTATTTAVMPAVERLQQLLKEPGTRR